MAEMNTRMEQINTRITGIETGMAEMNTRMEQINTRMVQMNASLEDMANVTKESHQTITMVDARMFNSSQERLQQNRPLRSAVMYQRVNGNLTIPKVIPLILQTLTPDILMNIVLHNPLNEILAYYNLPQEGNIAYKKKTICLHLNFHMP